MAARHACSVWHALYVLPTEIIAMKTDKYTTISYMGHVQKDLSKADKTLTGFSFMYTLIATLMTHALTSVGSNHKKYSPQRSCTSTATALYKTNQHKRYV